MKNGVVCLLCCLLLTGCFDAVEIENRGFVITLGIDTYKAGKKNKTSLTGDSVRDRFLVSMAMPDVSAMEGQGGEELKTIKTASNETVIAAMKAIDSYSSENLYFGHTKVVVFGEDVLKDEALFREAMDSLERNRDISRKVVVLAAENAEKVVRAESVGEPMIGMFVAKFYKNNHLGGITFKKDLESIIRDLQSGDCTIIPKITDTKEGVKISGAAVMKNYKLTEWLDDVETRGALFFSGQAEGAQIVEQFDDVYVPLSIYRTGSKRKFYEQDGKVICELKMSIKGTVQEYTLSDETLFSREKTDTLVALYQKSIVDEVLKTLDVVYDQHHADGFMLAEEIRKKAFSIYQKYDTPDELLNNLVVIPSCTVEITSTGSIK